MIIYDEVSSLGRFLGIGGGDGRYKFVVDRAKGKCSHFPFSFTYIYINFWVRSRLLLSGLILMHLRSFFKDARWDRTSPSRSSLLGVMLCCSTKGGCWHVLCISAIVYHYSSPARVRMRKKIRDSHLMEPRWNGGDIERLHSHEMGGSGLYVSVDGWRLFVRWNWRVLLSDPQKRRLWSARLILCLRGLASRSGGSWGQFQMQFCESLL